MNSVAPAPAVNKQSGVWGTWGLWSTCSVTCGGSGLKQRTRTCSIPNQCQGQPTEQASCTESACPIPQTNEPSWTAWTDWNQCSSSCGIGSQARYRRCTTPQNTIAFSCIGMPTEVRSCEGLLCPGMLTSVITPRSITTSNWNAWGTWSECSKLCGRGIRTRSRSCPVVNGCVGSAFEQNYCNEQNCPTSTGSWTQWSDWAFCSVTCGNGVKKRTRACPAGNCPGTNRETTTCMVSTCQVSNAQWGGWGLWSTPNDQKIRRRIRKCYGSGSCPGLEVESEKVA